MKKLLILLLFLGFIGCETKEEVIIPYDDITIVDGIVYFKKDSSLVTGTVKRWHKNGQLYLKATIKDGKRNGEYIRWYDTGDLNLKSIYEDGKLISQETF